jgi:uncharacterized protein YbjT (DUF2867 family)
MAYVLVTGPSGTLGSVLVPRLLAAGHAVRVLAHCRTGDFGPEVEIAHGDVRRLADVMEAASGVDVIVHAATSVFRAARSTEIDGARAVVAAAGASGAHLTYPSIVGVDVIGGTYYRAKLQAEQIIKGSGSWTIQRATQLHPTLNRTIGRLFPATSKLAFQPLDAGELADCLVGHIDAGDTGSAEDFGGPEVLTLKDLVSVRRSITGTRTLLIPLPAIGPLRALDAGHQLCPAHARGRLTWRQWLENLKETDDDASQA